MQKLTITIPCIPIVPPLVLAGILLATLLIAGCTTQASSIGTPAQPQLAGQTSIGDIVKDPAVFEGKEVVVKGKITNECGSGCWFMMDDGTGVVYVDLAPNDFAIPQIQGSTVVVKGIIHVANGDPTINATSVTTDSRTYP